VNLAVCIKVMKQTRIHITKVVKFHSILHTVSKLMSLLHSSYTNFIKFMLRVKLKNIKKIMTLKGKEKINFM